MTRSRYSHAGIAVWWNERLMLLEAQENGVLIMPLSRKIRTYRGMIELFVSREPIADERRLEMIQYAQMELGKEYARWAVVLLGIMILFGVKLKRGGRSAHKRLFCSQYVADIYDHIGIDLAYGKDNVSTSPSDIERSPQLESRGVLQR